ncbi:hypothetical protein [Natronorubrum halophilum]|nr:hypothetical protein [Natronorubrum halophilum]
MTTDRQRLFARRAMWVSVAIGLLGTMYFTTSRRRRRHLAIR